MDEQIGESEPKESIHSVHNLNILSPLPLIVVDSIVFSASRGGA